MADDIAEKPNKEDTMKKAKCDKEKLDSEAPSSEMALDVKVEKQKDGRWFEVVNRI